MNISEKFCPVCKKLNEREALVCKHCGAALDKISVDQGRTTRNANGQDGSYGEGMGNWPISESDVPAGGIAIYVGDTSTPAFFSRDREFIVGRKAEPTSENVLDLSNLGGYLLGLSRRHAKIRQTAQGYEIIDLASTNGTWLNEHRLLPNQPYPLASSSHVRMGRMRFFIVYHSTVKTRQRA